MCQPYIESAAAHRKTGYYLMKKGDVGMANRFSKKVRKQGMSYQLSRSETCRSMPDTTCLQNHG